MPRLTPQEVLDREMQKLKDMGVTISTTPAPGRREGFEDRPFGIIDAAARRAGIHEDSTKPEPDPKPWLDPVSKGDGDNEVRWADVEPKFEHYYEFAPRPQYLQNREDY